MKKQGTVYTIIFTFITAFFFVTILALTNEGTRKTTELNQELAEKRAFLNILGIEYEEAADIIAAYDSRITEETIKGVTLYKARVEGETRTAVRFSGPGLWGTITGALGVKSDLSRIVGIEIIDQNETPGLGGRITETWFTKQFEGEKIINNRILIRGSGDNSRENGLVDAITGASRTSQAMETIINNSIKSFRDALGTE